MGNSNSTKTITTTRADCLYDIGEMPSHRMKHHAEVLSNLCHDIVLLDIEYEPIIELFVKVREIIEKNRDKMLKSKSSREYVIYRNCDEIYMHVIKNDHVRGLMERKFDKIFNLRIRFHPFDYIVCTGLYMSVRRK